MHAVRFDADRWTDALLVEDPGFTEQVVGLWLCAMHGLVLIIGERQMWPPVHTYFNQFWYLHEVAGGLLLVCGFMQILAPGVTVQAPGDGGQLPVYRSRAALAFAIAVTCLAVFLLFAAAIGYRTIAVWSWLMLAVTETAIAWRLLLARIAVLEVAARRKTPDQQPAIVLPGG